MTLAHENDFYDKRKNILLALSSGEHACPKCGALMIKMCERYDLTDHYEDKWWECSNPNCTCCISDNQSAT